MKPINALRVSVTDRCNLRCIYCMPAGGVPLIPHDEVLRFEEIERIVKAAVRAGVTKVRITGGEPLVRRGLPELIERLARVPGLRDLPMTTNGILLAPLAADLKRAGLTRVTVSLDTLQPRRFARIAGRPWLHLARAGIAAALAAGLTPLKINVVIVPGENDDEAMDFVGLAAAEDLEVRFIERMPLLDRTRDPHCGIPGETYLPSARLRERIEAETGPLAPLPGQEPGSPARVFRLPKGKGRIGFIAPISEPFCKFCGRMRLTPEGKLRPCLARDLEVDAKTPLRQGASDSDLDRVFARAVALKPDQDSCFTALDQPMSRIGG